MLVSDGRTLLHVRAKTSSWVNALQALTQAGKKFPNLNIPVSRRPVWRRHTPFDSQCAPMGSAPPDRFRPSVLSGQCSDHSSCILSSLTFFKLLNTRATTIRSEITLRTTDSVVMCAAPL
eukprot:sb/3476159/